MKAQFTTSPDGTRIAYERIGTGPAIVLIHGGGSSRHEWHDAGYVARLQDDFAVVTLDLRGHGESSKPTNPADYTTDKLGQDILAVADACKIKHFTIWGMSYGGKISRYLAVKSERVTRFVMMGTPMGCGVSSRRRQEAVDFRAHWTPIVQAQREGTLDRAALSPNDLTMMENLHIPSMLAWVTAMLDWSTVVPTDFHCPTLWLIDSEDHAQSLRNSVEKLDGPRAYR